MCRKNFNAKMQDFLMEKLLNSADVKVACYAVCLLLGENKNCLDACEEGLEAKETIQDTIEQNQIFDDSFDCLKKNGCIDAALN